MKGSVRVLGTEHVCLCSDLVYDRWSGLRVNWEAFSLCAVLMVYVSRMFFGEI